MTRHTINDAPTGDLPPGDAPAGAGSLIAGRYRLLTPLGQGGMGTVWHAEQLEPVRRLVALKLIRAGLDSQQVLTRFEAERQALALMDHPNIAKVFDAGTAAGLGSPFFVMELVPGAPITAYCDQRRLTPRQRLELFAPVCDALQHAHLKGVIHRDVKPSNVLVADYDGRPVPKVIDFGIAKATGDAALVTADGALVGTPVYMSPEQAGPNSADVDTRSDVYALGVLLYELLTGRTPVGPGPLLDVLRRIRDDEPTRPSAAVTPDLAASRAATPADLTRLLRGELDWVLLKALEKDRVRRYQSAAELADDVRRYLADRPVSAHPPTFAYRARKLLRRYRGAAVAGALLFAALVAGSAGTTWGWLRAQRERATAVRERDDKEAARAEAQAGQERAVAAEADTKAFSDFLVHQVLAAARPAGVMSGLGVDVKVSDALAAAERHLDAAFTGRPKAEAEARHVLGVTWRNLGKYDAAERHLRRALALREEQFGPAAEATCDSRNSLAALLGQAGRPAESLPLYRENLRYATARLGPDHRLVLLGTSNLATALLETKQYDEAERLYRDAAERLAATLGPDHPEALTPLGGLSYLLHERQRYAEAEALFRRVIAARTTRLGADHPDTLLSQHNLAGLYRDLGRLDEAVALYRAVVAGRTTKLGADHPNTAISRGALADLYIRQRRPDRALPLQRDQLAAAERRQGSDDPATDEAKANLAVTYWQVGKFADAIALYEPLLAARAKRRGDGHPDVLFTALNLAVNYRDADRLLDAVRVLDRHATPASARAALGRPMIDGGLSEATAVYEKAGAWAKAAALQRELARHVGPKKPQAWVAWLLRARQNLTRAGDVAGARVLTAELALPFALAWR